MCVLNTGILGLIGINLFSKRKMFLMFYSSFDLYHAVSLVKEDPALLHPEEPEGSAEEGHSGGVVRIHVRRGSPVRGGIVEMAVLF